MIVCLRSMYTFYYPKGMGLGVAMYTCRRESTKDRVEGVKSYLYLDGMYLLPLYSFYLLYRSTCVPIHLLNYIHTISSCELRLLVEPRLKN